jgi:hypothetical protein
MLPTLIAISASSLPAQADEPSPARTCEVAFDDQQIKGISARAQDAFANLDEEGFSRARDEVLEAVPCASEPLTSSSAAGYFRVRALDAHLRRSPGDLQANVQAMSEIDPLPPSTSVTPKGHPVRNAWDLARQSGPGPREQLPVPNGGRLRIDGLDVLDRPTARPTIVQLLDQDGALTWTQVLEPGDRVPVYPIANSDDALARYRDAVIIERPRKPVELPVLAGVFGAGAIGTWAATFQTRQDFLTAAPEDLATRRNTNNALVVTSAGLAGAALALGTWTVVAW